MSNAAVHSARVHEDGSFSVLARVTSLDATGDEQALGEGGCVQQADVSSIACKVYSLGTDPDNLAGTEVTPAPTVAVASSVLDTLRTAGWTKDTYGYNFRHDVAPAYVPNPNEYYLVEYKFTLVTGGAVAFLKVLVKTLPTRVS